MSKVIAGDELGRKLAMPVRFVILKCGTFWLVVRADGGSRADQTSAPAAEDGIAIDGGQAEAAITIGGKAETGNLTD